MPSSLKLFARFALLAAALAVGGRSADGADASASTASGVTSTATTTIGTFKNVPGPNVEIEIKRGNARMPASLVPYTKPGDVLIVKFPFANPSLQKHRFHTLLANLRGIDTPTVEHYALFENGNYAKDFEITVRDGYSPVVLLFPEAGERAGRGVPQLTEKLQKSPAIFLQAASASVDTAAQRSRADELLRALRSGLEKEMTTRKARLNSFAADLNIKLNQDCFSEEPGLRTPCLLRSATSQLQNVPHDATKLIGDLMADQVMRAAPARYSFYLGAVLDLYFFFAHAHTPPQYKLVPGALLTHNGKTVLGLDQPYDADANPAPVAYVSVPSPTEGPPDTPTIETDTNDVTCLRGAKVVLPVEIKGDASDYATDWRLELFDDAGHKQSAIPIGAATPVSGAALDASLVDHNRLPALGHLKARVSAKWGFVQLSSDVFSIAMPQHAAPQAEIFLASAGDSALLKLTGASGYCVEKVSFRDALGREATATINSRSDSEVIASLDLRQIARGSGHVIVEQDAAVVDEIEIDLPATDRAAPH